MQTINEYLHQYELADLFPPGVIDSMHIESFAAGHRLFSQGDAADTLYLLVEGKLKISMLSPEGKRLILAFKTPFDIVGDIEYVQKCPFINTVEAVTDLVLLRVPHKALDHEMSGNALFQQFLLETITRKFVTKAQELNFNLLYAVDVRVASYLLSMTPDKPRLDSPSLVDMADLIGTSYRHLNRVLQKFEQSGWIQRNNGKIDLLDRDALLDQAGHNIYE
ncbi:MAG: Crp/Fnr family transcriptional regulator [Bacillota bacterium]